MDERDIVFITILLFVYLYLNPPKCRERVEEGYQVGSGYTSGFLVEVGSNGKLEYYALNDLTSDTAHNIGTGFGSVAMNESAAEAKKHTEESATRKAAEEMTELTQQINSYVNGRMSTFVTETGARRNGILDKYAQEGVYYKIRAIDELGEKAWLNNNGCDNKLNGDDEVRWCSDNLKYTKAEFLGI